MKAVVVVLMLTGLVARVEADPCADRAKALQAKLEVQQPEYYAYKVQPPTVSHWRESDRRRTVIVILDKTGKARVHGVNRPFSGGLLSQAIEEQEDDDPGKRGVAVEIVADAAAPAAKLYAIARAVPKRIPARLVVARDKPEDQFGKATVPAGSASWVTTWLDDARKKHGKPEELGPHLREGIKRATGTQCADLPAAFKKIAESDLQTRSTAPAQFIPPALLACKCAGVDPGFDLMIELSSVMAAEHGWLVAPVKALKGNPKTVAAVATALAATL